MVKMVRSWNPAVQWVMGIAAVAFVGVATYVIHGAIKANANEKIICDIKELAKHNADKISTYDGRLIRIETNTDYMIRQIDIIARELRKEQRRELQKGESNP